MQAPAGSDSTKHANVIMHAVKWEQQFELSCVMSVDQETDIVEPYLVRLSVRRVRNIRCISVDNVN